MQGRQETGRGRKRERKGRRYKWWAEERGESGERQKEKFLHVCVSELGQPMTAIMVLK